jgi:hypothetical protein
MAARQEPDEFDGEFDMAFFAEGVEALTTEQAVTEDELADATLTLEIVRVLEAAGILRPMVEGERLQLAGNILGSVYKARYPLALAA